MTAWAVNRCGVEQWQLVGLITRRSLVRIQAPLLDSNSRPLGSPAVFGLWGLAKGDFCQAQGFASLLSSKDKKINVKNMTIDSMLRRK
jgi:hypothetical protein